MDRFCPALVCFVDYGFLRFKPISVSKSECIDTAIQPKSTLFNIEPNRTESNRTIINLFVFSPFTSNILRNCFTVFCVSVAHCSFFIVQQCNSIKIQPESKIRKCSFLPRNNVRSLFSGGIKNNDKLYIYALYLLQFSPLCGQCDRESTHEKITLPLDRIPGCVFEKKNTKIQTFNGFR